MSSKIQRTKIESKSQPCIYVLHFIHCCHQKYKEQKLKANHNQQMKMVCIVYVVIKNTKNKNWKQITTSNAIFSSISLLSSKIQRTKIESKSQLSVVFVLYSFCCHQKYKEQKLKANHNHIKIVKVFMSVVIKNTKNKNWKQITTADYIEKIYNELSSKIQRTKIESKSQPT